MRSQERNAHLPQALTWELHVEVNWDYVLVLFLQNPVGLVVLTVG